MKAKRIGEKKSNGFLYFVLSLCGCLSLITMAGLHQVVKMTRAYEQSLPEHAARQVVELLAQEQWQPLSEYLSPPLSEFEGMEQVQRHFVSQEGFDRQKLHVQRSRGDTFDIFCGKRPVAALSVMKEAGGDPFGFGRYRPKELRFHLPPPKEYAFTLPRDAVLRINGKTVEQARLSKNEPLRYGSITCPETYVFRASGLHWEPDAAATLQQQPLPVRKNGYSFITKQPMTDDEIKTLSPAVIEAAQKYANFISNDAKFEDIRPLLFSGTVLYTHLSQFYNGWYIEHDSFAFRDMQLSNWEKLSDDVFACDASFAYIIKKGWREHVYPSSYRMVLTKTKNGDPPLLLDIQVI